MFWQIIGGVPRYPRLDVVSDPTVGSPVTRTLLISTFLAFTKIPDCSSGFQRFRCVETSTPHLPLTFCKFLPYGFRGIGLRSLDPSRTPGAATSRWISTPLGLQLATEETSSHAEFRSSISTRTPCVTETVPTHPASSPRNQAELDDVVDHTG